ncbi:MAG: hypothetical protein HC900_00935 [Methylacidiphilales bacterium]|nr:hypothetical protein [Candidatus Methylacidiphilales bacterium]
MTETFTDIKIKELDTDASGPSGEGDLSRVVFKLSQMAPSFWAEHFNHLWANNFHMKHRRARVSGNMLEIICMTDEVERDHLPELKKVIFYANEEYKKHLAKLERERKSKEDLEMRQKGEISDLKSRLDFD